MIPGTRPELDIADTFRKRLTGLLVGPPRPLLLLNTRYIHTIGMRYAIDVWFLDRRGNSLKCVREVRPFRLLGDRGSAHILECPSPSEHSSIETLLTHAKMVIQDRKWARH